MSCIRPCFVNNNSWSKEGNRVVAVVVVVAVFVVVVVTVIVAVVVVVHVIVIIFQTSTASF